MSKDSDLLVGLLIVLNGLLMLWQVRHYQRRVEGGEVNRDPSRPSFKTLRFAALGRFVLGFFFIVGWYFNPL